MKATNYKVKKIGRAKGARSGEWFDIGEVVISGVKKRVASFRGMGWFSMNASDFGPLIK